MKKDVEKEKQKVGSSTNTDGNHDAAADAVGDRAAIAGIAAIDMSNNMEQALCSYISQTLLPPDSGIEIKADDDLLSIDYLDSMQFMRLVQFTEETYSLKIPPEDLLIENFQTVERLTNYLSDRIARE